MTAPIFSLVTPVTSSVGLILIRGQLAQRPLARSLLLTLPGERGVAVDSRVTGFRERRGGVSVNVERWISPRRHVSRNGESPRLEGRPGGTRVKHRNTVIPSPCTPLEGMTGRFCGRSGYRLYASVSGLGSCFSSPCCFSAEGGQSLRRVPLTQGLVQWQPVRKVPSIFFLLGRRFSRSANISTRFEGRAMRTSRHPSLLLFDIVSAEWNSSRARVTRAVSASAIRSETLLASNSKARPVDLRPNSLFSRQAGPIWPCGHRLA